MQVGEGLQPDKGLYCYVQIDVATLTRLFSVITSIIYVCLERVID